MKNIDKLEIQYHNVGDIIPYDKNPRKNDEAVKYVKASIEKFGFKVPIVIDENKVVVCGHTRLKAAKEIGLEQVPCIMASDLTPEQIRAFRIADNKVAEIAEWDMDALKDEISELPDFDFGDFGFTDDELPQEDEEEKYDFEEDEDGKPVVEERTKRGDLWRLGEHTLMCGDSTLEADVSRLMGGGKADCLITDPPYNVAVTGGTGDKLTIMNDNMDEAQFDGFLGAVFKRAVEALKPGAAFYVWHASRTQRNFENMMNAAGMKVREQLVWVKDLFTLGRQDYQWMHELCFYGWMDGAAHRWMSDRCQSTVADFLPNAIMKRKNGSVVLKIGGKSYALKADAIVEEIKGTVLSFPKPARSEMHPTMKPVELIRYQMENSTGRDDTVLDLFGGSGTTMIAAERSGRKCRMMELDPKYATVILNRWEAETGQKAELVSRTEGADGDDRAATRI